jgi:Rps23 Pro-64 3,4-dihydroxylase Tpa1-like proline 4-hydroxylase
MRRAVCVYLAAFASIGLPASVEIGSDGSVNGEFEATFINRQAKSIHLYFGGSTDGALQPNHNRISTVAPGESTVINTRVGHIMVALDESGEGMLKRGSGGDPGYYSADTFVMNSSTTYEVQVRDLCDDTYPTFCQDQQERGECKKNPGWMLMRCTKSCNTCDLVDPKERCQRKKLNMTDEPAASPGYLSSMFKRIVERYGDDVTVLREDPFILTIDDYIDDETIAAILKTSEGKYSRSTDAGARNARTGEVEKKVSEGRTSRNAWCRGACNEHPLVKKLFQKFSETTGIVHENYEKMQVLHYEPGQYYRAHHDANSRQKQLICGMRILTVFLYLSDVEEGGHTGFPKLDIAVAPKKGESAPADALVLHGVFSLPSRVLAAMACSRCHHVFSLPWRVANAVALWRHVVFTPHVFTPHACTPFALRTTHHRPSTNLAKRDGC